jgi:MFS family permease
MLEASVAIPRGLAFWLMGALLGMLMLAAGAPSPLYSVYQEKWGFSATTLTTVFAVYALALLAAFLVAGRLSDHVGRKPVIIAALLVQALALACFLAANSVGWLYAARVIQGIATGTATGAVSAALVDLAPPGNQRIAPLLNSAAPTVGLAAGALGSSLLAAYGPAPMRLVYWILLAFVAAGLAGILVTSEPGQRRPGALASLRPQAGVPGEAWRAFAGGLPALIARWALGGFYLALGPSLAATLLHSADVVPGGVVIFLLAGVGAFSTIAGRTSEPAVAMRYGCLLLAVGAVATVGTIAAGSAVGFFIATAFTGVGFGLAFLGTFRTLTALAPPTGRAGLITAIYIVSYLAFSVPVIIAGIAVDHIGLHTTSIVFGALVAVLAAAVAAETVRSARHLEPATPAAGDVAPPPGPAARPASCSLPAMPAACRRPWPSMAAPADYAGRQGVAPRLRRHHRPPGGRRLNRQPATTA